MMHSDPNMIHTPPPDYSTLVGEPPPQYVNLAPAALPYLAANQPRPQYIVHQQYDSKIPQLKEFCCCYSLKSGVKIIGWFSVIGSFTALVVLSLSLYIGESVKRRLSSNDTKYSMLEIDKYELELEFRQRKSFAALSPVNQLYVFQMYVLFFVLGVVLLIGVYKGIQSYIKIWVVANTVLLVFMSFLLMLQFYKALIQERTTLTQKLTFTMIQSYFVLVVYSYYRDVESRKVVSFYLTDHIM